MARGIALAIAGVLFWLLALATGWQPAGQVAVGLAVVLLLSAGWVLNNLWRFSLARPILPQTTQVGQVLRDTYTLANNSPLPKLDLEIRDRSTLPGHRGSAICNVGPRQQVEHVVETLCEVRGVFTLGPTSAAGIDPFGLFSIERTLTPAVPVIVYPQVVDLGGFSMPRSLITEGTRMRRRTPMQTLDPAGTRPYVYGDSVRRVHWLSSAHSGELMVKEFEFTPAADVWIFLDLQRFVHVGYGQHSTEEYAVTAAASLAGHFLALGRSVGLVAAAESKLVVEADRGDRQLLRILDLLARVKADGHAPLRDVLWRERGRLNLAAASAVITPSVDERWPSVLLQSARSRTRSAVLLVEGATFGDAPGATIQVAGLTSARVPTYLIKRSRSVEQALKTALDSGRSTPFAP
ncbi:MAG TPA: DUF58 domain-containing protein [Chloroflexota bacterium]|nr:DUF58 domain-containing protein [Chloroflexota bacterium]